MEATSAMKVSVVKNLSEEDRTLLEASVQLDPYCVPIEKLMEQVEQGSLKILKIEEPFEALVVVQVITMSHGSTLFVLHLAGHSVIKHRALLYDLLQEIAEFNRCEYIACGSTRIGALRLYKGMGFQPFMTFCRRKV